MNSNVVKYEPSKALYVDDKDPLKFYHAIIHFSISALAANGTIFFEVNEAFGNDVARLLEKNNYHKIQLRKDINSKDRFVYGTKAR